MAEEEGGAIKASSFQGAEVPCFARLASQVSCCPLGEGQIHNSCVNRDVPHNTH